MVRLGVPGQAEPPTQVKPGQMAQTPARATISLERACVIASAKQTWHGTQDGGGGRRFLKDPKSVGREAAFMDVTQWAPSYIMDELLCGSSDSNYRGVCALLLS